MDGTTDETHGGWALELVTFGLWLALAALTLAGPLFVVLSLTSLSDPSSFTSVPSRLDPPYSIEFSGDRTVAVSADGTATFDGFAHPSYLEPSTTAPSVEMMVPIATEPWWKEVASTLLLLPVLALAWLATFNLLRVVRSARDGQPFSASNVSRLRWVAACAAAAPVALGANDLVTRRLLDESVSATPGTGPGSVTMLAIAVVVLALSEVVRVGIDLRDLNERTV